jgi:hypothetical protein
MAPAGVDLLQKHNENKEICQEKFIKILKDFGQTHRIMWSLRKKDSARTRMQFSQ